MVAPRLERMLVDGVAYWFAEPAPGGTPASPTVHLLQGYDEYIVGYSASKYLLDLSGAVRARPTERGIYNHAVVLDGQVVGHWKRTIGRRGVLIEAALHASLDDAQTGALQDAADRHGAFLGLPATLATRVL
jgi:hypothetical protein